MEIILGLIVLIAVLVIGGTFFTVKTQQAAIVERFGRYVRTAGPGLNVKIPFIDKKVATIHLDVRQLNSVVETKTKDNVFVTIPVAVQYKVPEGSERDSHYLLSNPEAQMNSFVLDNVRTTLSTLSLDEAFSSKDDIAKNLEETLQAQMNQYGYHIVNSLVTDINPAPGVRDAMNNINTSLRQKEAAQNIAEANKIAQVKKAEGDAEARRLQGEGVAAERHAIALGLAEQVKLLSTAGIKPHEAQEVLLMTQFFDTLKSLSESNNAKVLFVPSSPGGLSDMKQQIMEAIHTSPNPTTLPPVPRHQQ